MLILLLRRRRRVQQLSPITDALTFLLQLSNKELGCSEVSAPGSIFESRVAFVRCVTAGFRPCHLLWRQAPLEDPRVRPRLGMVSVRWALESGPRLWRARRGRPDVPPALGCGLRWRRVRREPGPLPVWGSPRREPAPRQTFGAAGLVTQCPDRAVQGRGC